MIVHPIIIWRILRWLATRPRRKLSPAGFEAQITQLRLWRFFRYWLELFGADCCRNHFCRRRHGWSMQSTRYLHQDWPLWNYPQLLCTAADNSQHSWYLSNCNCWVFFQKHRLSSNARSEYEEWSINHTEITEWDIFPEYTGNLPRKRSRCTIDQGSICCTGWRELIHPHWPACIYFASLSRFCCPLLLC